MFVSLFTLFEALLQPTRPTITLPLQSFCVELVELWITRDILRVLDWFTVCGQLEKMMNAAASLYRRLSIRDLIASTPIYSSATDVSGEGLSLVFRRWATKKTAGSTKNGRDSKPKNLGVKKFGGERVIPGNIIVRQRGTRFHPGNYVGIGKDHTLYALKEGCVKFEHNKLTGRKWIHVEPKEGYEIHPVYASAGTVPKIKTTA